MQSPAHFQFSARLIKAIHQSPQTLTSLGFACGLTQSRISAYLHGEPFGSRSRERVIQLGAALSLPPDACTRSAR
jgi:hypothetical protein